MATRQYPIPQDKIGESFVWRDWFQKLANRVFGSMGDQDANAVFITGGTIDNTVIGSTTPASGKFTYVELDQTAAITATAGQMAWNSGDGTVDIGMGYDGVIQQIGLETYYRIKASTAITNGQLVMFDGSVGASGVLKGKPSTTGLTNGQLIMGVATMDIANNGFGYVTCFGIVRGIDTTGSSVGETWADGDILYYNTAYTGSLTKVTPTAPSDKVIVAAVVNAGSGGSGSLLVRVHANPHMGDLSDVLVSSPANGHTLIWDNTNTRWTNATITPGSNISITNAAGSITVATSGYTGTAVLAKITAGGTNGSLTISNGIVTAYTAPT